MKIEVGKYYKNTLRDVVGPISYVDHPTFMFHAGGKSYTTGGTFYNDGDTSPFDLVEECNADGSSIESEESHLGTASWETTFDKQRRVEIAQAILCAMIASPPVCNRAEVDKAKWCGIAFEWADMVIKVAKQS